MASATRKWEPASLENCGFPEHIRGCHQAGEQPTKQISVKWGPTS